MLGTTQFWLGVQTLVMDQNHWGESLEALGRDYARSSPEVREQMQRDVETALGRLIAVDRMMHSGPSAKHKEGTRHDSP